MTAKERELRKTLLLIKGDALRLQLGLEIDMLRDTLSLSGLLGRVLPQAVAGLFGATGRRPRGLWRLLRFALGSLGVWRALSTWFKRD
ncbi:hypothetical protein [Paludibacterium purpuratum]|uniref:YqjK-like protein n=1 Tax=Paludibacterium purpuratum TaxID=1144873 RepID=A0A4R7B1P1_9NEIS|nr:hypothetical protein [Paludibacterium purpuratum]TDR73857.1 hypothetical protein DFP86_11261 [Paludibacterium purpuratum]